MKMQRIRILAGSFLAGLLVFQCVYADDVRLKDGSLIKGEVIDEVPGESITLRRADGSENVFQMSTVESVSRSPALSELPDDVEDSESDSPDDLVYMDSDSPDDLVYMDSDSPDDLIYMDSEPIPVPSKRKAGSVRLKKKEVPNISKEPQSKSTSGLSFGFGIGGMIPKEDQAYGGEYGGSGSVEVYPEFRIARDTGPLELALSVGYVASDKTSSERIRNSRGYYRTHYYESKIAFVPVEFHIHLLPVRFSSPRFPVQPYLGVGFGAYIAAGDNEDSYPILTPAGGIAFHLGRHHILALDFSYHVVFDDSRSSSPSDPGSEDMDYGTFMLQYRVRIPFGR